jgi:hypothetical protein
MLLPPYLLSGTLTEPHSSLKIISMVSDIYHGFHFIEAEGHLG